MTSPWLSYVPYNLARDILEHPGASPVGREQRCAAVALFADVSGFTAISEALGQAGRTGTEELTRILNAYFDTMIGLINSYGGLVGQFGGDAVTVLFPHTPGTPHDAARRAIQCALDMQANMGRYAAIPTRAGVFALSMKAGLGTGSLLCTTVGDPAVGLKFIIAGEPLDQCADAEHHASRGEVVVHDSLLPLAGEIEIVETRAGFSCVGGLAQRPAPQPLEPITRDLSAAERDIFAAYLPPVVAQRLRRGQSGFINEHRRVTVLFVNFGGFDYAHDPGVSARLQTYFEAVLRIVHRYEGTLNKIDTGDKGSKYIVLFGTPVAHEDDDTRALRCALELRALGDVPTRIGVNTGFVYCGLVGSPVRQEYTVMGDAVNLAARLMQAAAPGQILVSSHTQAAQGGRFAWTRLDPIRVKGKTEPVQVYAAEQIKGHSILQTQELDYALPMVGRAAELNRVTDLIEHVLGGSGQIVGITAEAGMGKTRLAAEIIRLATARGLAGHGGECESYGTNTSYLVWRHIWQTFFGLDPAAPLDQQIARLETQLAEVDPGFVNRLPLLGPVLNLPIPDNALTAPLDARLRKASLEALLVACVRHRAAVPLLFVLEDCHWIDPLSCDLLEVLARNIVDVPVLILMLYRPPELADLDRIRRTAHFTELVLAEFTRQEAETLIQLKLRQLFESAGEPPAGLAVLITAKAQGNPFYIDAMINLLHDQQIDPHDAAALESVDLPDSLHSLIVSRIDRLVEDEQIALKVASVIGRMFRADWLWQVYPPLGQPDRVHEQLNGLSRLDFVLPSSAAAAPELEYLFKHIVTQEVAYAGLAVATRERLHEAVGAFIEQAYPDDLDRFLDLLAYHYGHSQNTAKQRDYYRRAGDAAQQTYANDAAIAYYQHLLPLLPETDHPPVLLKLGTVWELTGKWQEAETTYRRALALAETRGDVPLQAECRNELGRLLTAQGAYEAALAELDTARAQFEQVDDQNGLGKVTNNTGVVFLHQGDSARALEHFERGLALATGTGDKTLASTILNSLGVVYGMQGDAGRSLDYFEQEVALRADSGDRRGASVATGNMGVIYEQMGDYAQALTCYMHHLRITAEVGDQRGVSMAVGNMGILYSLHGEHERAVQCFVQQLQIALELSNRRVIGFALADLAKVFKREGRFPAAEPLYAHAVAFARQLNARYDLCDYLHQQADLYARQERPADAAPLNTAALDTAREVERKEIEFAALVLDARLRAAPDDLIALLDIWTQDDQQAALHYELARLGQDDHRRQAADLYRALYAKTPNVEYRERYAALTGDALNAPPPLPELPERIRRRDANLRALLARAEELVTASHE